MRSLFRTGAALCFALAAAVAPWSAKAAEEQEIIEMSKMSQDVKVYVSKTGEQVVDHIEKAQKLMAGTIDFDGARRETGKAMKLLKTVEHVSPTARFHALMADLLHKHKTKKAKPEDLLPVMAVLDDIKQVNGAAVVDVQTKLEKVKGKLQAEPTAETEADLIAADESIGYLEIDLPVQATEGYLAQALMNESMRDAANANANLTAALEHTKKWTAKAEVKGVEADAEEAN